MPAPIDPIKTNTRLPLSGDGKSFPVPILMQRVAHKISASGVSTINSVDFTDGVIIRVFCIEDIYFVTGDNLVTATTNDFFVPANTPYDIPLGNGNTNIAVITNGPAAVVEITEF